MGVIGAFFGLIFTIVGGLLGLFFNVVGFAFSILGGIFGLVFALVAVVLQLALIGAVVAGGVWAFRRLQGGSSRQRTLGSRSTDMQYLRGRIDRGTYVRRKALERGR